MRAPEIAAALGGAHRSGIWYRCRCPVHCSRCASLALRDGKHGLIPVCHAGCPPAEIMAALRSRALIGFGAEERPTPPWRNASDDHARRIESARRIWGQAQDAHGTAVAAYLTGRGITMAAPPVLRWASSLLRVDGTHGPAMVAAITGPEGTLIGIQRTWLRHNGDGLWQRRDRAMLGRAAGGAVRLARAAETLLVGEGIETCLAVMQATALPAWAALSTSGVVALVLPAIVRSIIILADHDVSGAGERAARAAAAQWMAGGCRVKIAMPPDPGSDFNDVLLDRGYAEVCDVAA